MDLRVDGRIAFAATGGRARDAAIPDVVLLHGAGMDHTVWTLQARYLAHHARNVLALDLPGHGRSEGAPLASIGDMASWVLRALDAAGCASAAIAGHSMGALVALATAAAAPGRVRGLALLGAAASMPVHPDLLKAARAGDHAAIDLVASWGFGRRAQLGGAQAPGTWMLGGGIRLLERDANGALATDLAACAAHGDALAHAASVACPALVVSGAQDRMTPPRGGRALAAAIPGARFVEIPACGHMMTIEQPDLALDAMKEVL